jgi:hypothetical protein
LNSTLALKSKPEQTGAQPSSLIGDVVPGVVAPSLAGLVPQEGPIAEPFSLCAEKLGQGCEIVHSLDLRAIRLAIGFTIAKNRVAPNLPGAGAEMRGRPLVCRWQGLDRVDMVRQFIGFGSARILGGNLDEDAPMTDSTTGFRWLNVWFIRLSG